MNSLATLVQEAEALATATGIQSPVGIRDRNRFITFLNVYFDALTFRVMEVKLEERLSEGTDQLVNRGMAAVNTLDRSLANLLLVFLTIGFDDAVRQVDRVVPDIQEAAGDPPTVAQLGALFTDQPVSDEALEFAARHSAGLVTDMSDTTRKRLRSFIEQGLSEQLGVPGTATLLQENMRKMGRHRSRLIALTEMNAAASAGTIHRLVQRGFLFKTVVLSDRPCPICIANNDQGVIPVDAQFQSGHTRSPFHPGCLCTVTAARAPKGQGPSTRRLFTRT